MFERTAIRRFSLLFLLVTLLHVSSVRDADAQGFLGASFGYAFGGDAGCPEITNCENKNWNYGFSLGALGNIVGFEAEFLYAKDFFGDIPNQSSKVLTFTGNFMLAPKIGAVQPYGLAGLGLIKTSIDSADPLLTDTDNNQIGWDIGGGLMVFFGEHVGARGELRYYHSFQALDFLNDLPLPIGENETKIDFGRVSGGVVVKF